MEANSRAKLSNCGDDNYNLDYMVQAERFHTSQSLYKKVHCVNPSVVQH